MKTRIFKTTVLLFIAAILLSFDLPNGWYAGGSNPENYEMGIAKGEGYNGKNAATIKSIGTESEVFGILSQSCSPNNYMGKQVKMTAYVRSENVEEWAGLWLLVDQPGTMKFLSSDNMHDRAITGTTEWKEYEILLPVPENATGIEYGAILFGKGQIWFDNVTIEVIDNSDNPKKSEESNRSDSYNKKETVTTEPVNLDFEQ